MIIQIILLLQISKFSNQVSVEKGIPVQTFVTIDHDIDVPSTYVTVAKVTEELSLLDNVSLKYEDYNENFGSILDLSDIIHSE